MPSLHFFFNAVAAASMNAFTLNMDIDIFAFSHLIEAPKSLVDNFIKMCYKLNVSHEILCALTLSMKSFGVNTMHCSHFTLREHLFHSFQFEFRNGNGTLKGPHIYR